jgi:flagellar basal body rod protein FlgC
MGNKTSFGFIKTQKTVYANGETIFGEFCLKCHEDMYAQRIVLKVTGVEVAEWEEMQNNTMRQYRGSQIIIDYSEVLFRVPYDNMPKGDYIFPFAIELPFDIPSSTTFTYPRLKGRIQYMLDIYLEGTDIKASADIKVINFKHDEPLLSEAYSKLKGCLWIERGEVYLRGKPSKSMCTSAENLRVYVDFDISKSSWNVANIDISIVQIISVNSGEKKYIRRQVVFNKNIPTPGQQFGVDLPIRDISPDARDAYSCAGRVIEIAYSVEIIGVMDSIFSAYGEEPQIAMWFSLNPHDHPPEIPQCTFSWKPAIQEMGKRTSVPIFR